MNARHHITFLLMSAVLFILSCHNEEMPGGRTKEAYNRLKAVADSVDALSPRARALVDSALDNSSDSLTYYDYYVELGRLYLMTQPESVLQCTERITAFVKSQETTPRVNGLMAEAKLLRANFDYLYHQNYKDALDYLENSVVKANGYVVAIMNERVLNPYSGSRYELLKAMHDNKSIGKETPNIIPFATQDTVVGLIQGDKELASLSMCNIQSVDGLDIDRQSEEIVKRVVSQLMTPGSIKVLADNLCKGTFGELNLKEADFLYGLLDNVQKEFALTSESGTFIVDSDGIVLRFEPSEGNPIIEEKVDEPQAYDGFVVKKSIKHLIVPAGVKGFVSDFMRGIRVLERFSLPNGLLCIGNNTCEVLDNDAHCVFADCILPTVVVPESVKELGSFTFGHTRIECLQLPESLHSPYGRQFKDSFIGTLRLPKEWKEGVSLDEYGRLHLTGWFSDDKYGYLRWPSTHVEKLEFY